MIADSRDFIGREAPCTGKDRKREFKYYRLTAAGKKQLTAEESKWKKLADAIGRVMWPVEET